MNKKDTDKKSKRLGDAELEIMMVLWDSSEPVTSTYILGQLKGRRNWALSTLMTTLSRLAEKGFVCCDRSTRTNYYSALVSEEDYKAQEGRTFLEKLYGNSVQNLVASLYHSKAISGRDLDELKQMIEQIERSEQSRQTGLDRKGKDADDQ